MLLDSTHYHTHVTATKQTHYTVYLIKYAHCWVVLCFVLFTLVFSLNSCGLFTHILQGCFTGTGAIV